MGRARVASDRSIPACAGKPRASRCRCAATRVHPRVCGETRRRPERDRLAYGPSPRVRGNLAGGCDTALPVGSIPACAGKRASNSDSVDASKVHPRVCGENHAVAISPWPVRGSIPACAGKPGQPHRLRRAIGVHPRVCGETSSRCCLTSVRSGPSPRVRGNRGGHNDEFSQRGSIPACAGKPAARRRPNTPTRGPSPRVRGNRQPVDVRIRPPGSIPACAGKPRARGRRAPVRRVHPRVCGETMGRLSPGMPPGGPSPRVRGNLPKCGPDVTRIGSIPACAGKPSQSRGSRRG